MPRFDAADSAYYAMLPTLERYTWLRQRDAGPADDPNPTTLVTDWTAWCQWLWDAWHEETQIEFDLRDG